MTEYSSKAGIRGSERAVPTAHDQEGQSVSVQEILVRIALIIRRTLAHWPVMVVAFTLGVGAFFIAPRVVPPVFASSVVLAYREVIQQEALLGNNLVPAESRRVRNARLRDTLLSRMTLQPIMQAHGISRGGVNDPGSQDALDDFRKAIRCDISEGDVYTVTYQGRTAKEVHDVTRSLGQALVEAAKEYGVEQAEATRAFLQAQLDTATKSLSKAEQALAEFSARHPEFGLTDPTSARMGRAPAANPTTLLTRIPARETGGASVTLQRRAAILNRQIAEFERQGSQGGPPTAAAQPATVASPTGTVSAQTLSLLRVAEGEVSSARQILDDKKSHYTDRHPDVVAAQTRMDSAVAKLRAARLRVQEEQEAATVAEVKPPEPSGTAALTALKDQLRQVEANIAAGSQPAAPARAAAPEAVSLEAIPPAQEGIVALETEWTALNREVLAARERNEQLERQVFRISMLAKVQTSGGGSQLVIMDNAILPRHPARRGPRRTGAVGFLITFVLGIGVALGLTLLDDRIRVESDAMRLGIGPLVHGVPRLNPRERTHA